MQPLTFYLNARRLTRDEAHALYVDDAAPEQPVRLALVIRGTERHVFPALVLDDWGREKKGLSLYHWLYEQGPRFPRAELFGFDAQGAETQIFLRDLELSFKYPCFIFASSGAPLPEGRRLSAIFVPGEPDQSAPEAIDPPDKLPLGPATRRRPLAAEKHDGPTRGRLACALIIGPGNLQDGQLALKSLLYANTIYAPAGGGAHSSAR